MSIRVALISLGLAFAVYQAARGLLWTSTPELPWLFIVAIIGFAITSIVAIFAAPKTAPGEEPRREPMPVWSALVALLAAVVLPSATGFAVGGDLPPTYATWYVGGVGALMVVVMVRGRPILAWMGTAALAIGAMIWMGPITALSQGLVGSVVWVGVAQLVVVLIGRAERDAAELGELQAMTTAWEAGHEARERERRVQLQRALAVGGPILTRVIAMHGVLSDDERRDAGIAEARLRDELRGPRLLDDSVRAEIDAARRRGSQVSVFDEGGLDGLNAEALAAVRSELADALHGASSERIIIRTSPHDRVAVTVVGRGRVDGEYDGVELWREIEAPERREGSDGATREED